MKKCLSLSLAATLATLSWASLAQEKAGGPIQTANDVDPGDPKPKAIGRDEALRLDATALAEAKGIPFGRAMKIIRLTEERGDMVGQLRDEFRGRIAGISIEQEPEYTIVVKLKGANVPTKRAQKFAAGDVAVRFEAGAQSTVEEMVTAYTGQLDQIRAIVPEVQSIGVDEKTGQIAINVYAPGSAAQVVAGKRDDLAKLLGHPVRVEAVSYQVGDSDVRGGAKIDGTQGYCTSGFTVKNASNVTGMSTAAHCEGIKNYYNPGGAAILLTHTGVELRDADQDVEIHTSGYIERAEFYADSTATARILTGRRTRASTTVGDVVCHRGETTGYSCGAVSKTNTVLTYTNACNGVTCSATWVTVTGDANTACNGGDSGGPVFISQTAVGLLKGSTKIGSAKGQCGEFYYMSTDFLPTGWSLVYG